MPAPIHNHDWHSRLCKLLKHGCTLAGFILPFFRHLFFYPLGKLIYRNRNIWLFSERGTDARDNGYHLYRYVRENHPEIDAHYVISKDSSDREKLLPYGNLVDYQSFRHRLMYYGAKLTVSTHILNSAPDYHFQNFVRFRLHNDIVRNKMVFLQHGVIGNTFPSLFKENAFLSLFICGAKPEYESILRGYHYNADEVCYTGLPRFDQLHNVVTKPQILIMPTWRSWLVTDMDASAKQVRESEYVRRWNELLNSPELGILAEAYHKTIIFYPHYEMQKYLNCFSVSNPHVIIADHDHYDVQQLLKESELLITDYSSILFDFAYMRKPSLYYQFDEERFFSDHYQKGYFSYRRDGFGEVTSTQEELLRLIRKTLENNCVMQPDYEKRVSAFFPLYDTRNCQRVYEAILRQQ